MQENTEIVLNGAECYKISLLDTGNPYSSGKRKEAGKTFSRFSYNGVVFTVEDSLGFHTSVQKRDLQQVTLINSSYERTVVDANNVETKVPVKSLQFGSFLPKSVVRREELEDALHAAKVAAIGAASANLTPEMVSALMSADI
jgi:hypothetical protein